MGCSQSTTTVGTEATGPASTAGASASSSVEAAAKLIKFDAPVDWLQMHSAVRWNRNEAEVLAMLMEAPDNANLPDPKTGNLPLHIAAQNGHDNLVKLLLKHQAVVNAQNNKGQTSMHMAVGYDYYDVACTLKEAGADDTKENQAGFAARHGLDGDKSMGYICLVQSKTADDANKAFSLMEIEPGKIPKADYVKTGLRLKKEIGEKDWPLVRFKAVLAML